MGAPAPLAEPVEGQGMGLTKQSINLANGFIGLRLSGRSKFRPRLDQERRHCGDQERDRDTGKHEFVTLRVRS